MEAQADRSATLLRAMANPQRLRLVCELMAGERGVGELEELTGIRQPALSKELGKLREAGVIEGRRESKAVFYRLIDERVPGIIASLCGREVAPTAAHPRPSPVSERGSVFARIVQKPF
ncbi:transcriptional regulator, ArsR family protein [Parvularcula bermudensis HTCC2503]|uniref:Transcriptional regulator, ArsR family protein n=2 Tax=Parvularcula TaxID=208215 RepID=E0TDK3_PARBH|nr:transcriptional regulator, ArsR family protein [Parvularcula bermudensis HTCC2503]